MYAVIQAGGRQHRVEVDEVIRVDSLDAGAGEPVVFDKVYMVGDGESVRIGKPTLEGAQVRGTVVSDGRDDKILVYTYKRRKYSNRKRRGHRQSFTEVKIDAIEA